MKSVLKVTGLILAGGLGSRMGYVDKASLEVGGTSILDRLLGVYERIFPEIVIAAGKPDDESRDWGIPESVRLVHDRFEGRGSLAGIHAGLAAASNFYVFAAACDAPFVSPKMIRLLLDRLEPEDDVVIPCKEDGRVEPLCALYSKRCLPHIEKRLQAGDFKIIRFFPEVRVKEVDAELLRRADPEFRSFINVNTPEDLRAADGK